MLNARQRQVKSSLLVMAMASDSSSLFSGGKPAVNPWFIAIAVMLATFMEVLDTSIANVALNHIAGNLSASTDEATWVLTSYLVSNAVVLPATGWLGRFFGRKRFLIVCIGIFTIASALCGLASSLDVHVWWSNDPDRSQQRSLANHYQRFCHHLDLRSNGDVFNGDDVA
jgi:hypothetical protein